MRNRTTKRRYRTPEVAGRGLPDQVHRVGSRTPSGAVAGSGESSEEGHVEQRRAPESWATRLKGTIGWGLVAVVWGVVVGVAGWFVFDLMGLPIIGSSPTLIP